MAKNCHLNFIIFLFNLLYFCHLVNGSPLNGSSLIRDVESASQFEGNSLHCPSIIRPGQLVLKYENIPKHYRDMDYSTYTPIYYRSVQIEQDLKNGVKYPFKELTKTISLDPQGDGQPPITFVRQVVALASYPQLMATSNSFPTDAITKAQKILEASDSSVGSSSDPLGLELVRRNVAKFISQRDGGIPSDFENIYLADGVSGGISMFMELLQNECNSLCTGIMVPEPLYALYSGLLPKNSFHQINYYLNEKNNWELENKELERAYNHGVCNYACKPRAILIINPGNPSGKIFNRKTVEFIVKFAYKKNLLILSDEVFQDNLLGNGRKFESIKKVMMELESPYNTTELASFNSVSKEMAVFLSRSKTSPVNGVIRLNFETEFRMFLHSVSSSNSALNGYIGEAGLRGGYFELVNTDPKIKKVVFQLLAQRQSASVIGQVGLDCYVDPPKLGDPSYELFEREKKDILQNYNVFGLKLTEELNKLEGYHCNSIDAGLFAFTKITLPKKAIKAAKASGKVPDVFYGLELLEQTGIAVSVGSAFGLRPSQTYLRISIPQTMEKLEKLMKLLTSFHVEFMKKYS